MHLSALALDSLALGALDKDAEAAARAHLASCDRCRSDFDVAAEHRQHFTQHILPTTAPSARRGPSMRWGWLALPVLAAAAILLLYLRPGKPRPDDLGIKGDAALQVFANRGGGTFAVHDGTALAAGDRIRFVVTPNHAHYVIVASVDGAGTTSIYHPFNGDQSARVEDVRSELPGSILLDAAPGPERLFAIFSDDPISANDVKQALRMIAVGGVEAIRQAHSLELPARAQLTLVFEKAPP